MIKEASVAVDQAPHLRHGDGQERCGCLPLASPLWASEQLSPKLETHSVYSTFEREIL